jgi:IMP dehydrogenase
MVKSFAAGADLVMIGGLLSGTDETPLINGKRIFRGMASREAQTDFKGSVSNNTPEGTSLIPSAKGPVSGVIEQLAGGIRSGLTYSGCRDIKELQQNAKFIKISTNCLAENSPHGIGKL